MPIHYKRRLVEEFKNLSICNIYFRCRKSTNTRRNITLITPFELVLLGGADHERAERKLVLHYVKVGI